MSEHYEMKMEAGDAFVSEQVSQSDEYGCCEDCDKTGSLLKEIETIKTSLDEWITNDGTLDNIISIVEQILGDII